MIRKHYPSSRLPDGTYFSFCESHQKYKRTILADGHHPKAGDGNPGILELPLKTINAAAPIRALWVLIYGLLKQWGEEYGVLEI